MTLAPSSSRGSAGGPMAAQVLLIGTDPPKAQSNFDNYAINSELSPFNTCFSDDTNGAWIEWYAALGAGTYALAVKSWQYNGTGILSFSLDGTVITSAPYNASGATADPYNSNSEPSAQRQIVATDLDIPSDDTYVVRATVSGKNASSSGYATHLVYVSFTLLTPA